MPFGQVNSAWDILRLTAFRLAGLFVLVAVGVWLIVRVRWRLHSRDDPAAVDHAMLMQMNEMRRAGNLSDTEFRSIKGRLIKRLRQADAGRDQNASES